MQTIYYKTSNFIQYTGNIIDLTELRRRQAAAQRDSLARQPEVEAYLPEEEPGFRPVVLTLSPEERRQRALQALERVGLADKRRNLPARR